MIKQINLSLIAFTLTILALGGCSSFDQLNGESKSSPDEFQVVVRPPLTLPPSFSFTPEQQAAEEDAQNAEKTQAASSAVDTADEAITGTARADASGFDALFGTAERVAGIREIINAETYGIQRDRRVAVEVLFGGTPNVGPILNAEEEAIRIRKATSDNQSLDASPTPATDPISDEPVTIN